MAMACKPLTTLPPSLQTQRSHCGALNTRQRIKSHSYHIHESRSFSISLKAFRYERENSRRICMRAVAQEDEDREKHACTDEKANTDTPLCEGKTETKSNASSEQPEPVKEQQQQNSSEKEKLARVRGRLRCGTRKLGFRAAKSSEEMNRQDLQSDPKQPFRCRLTSWWQIVTRPQNLLAAFLAGLLSYAFALFGWQVMVVAADVTLFVLKCCFVAVVLIFLYIFLI